MGEWQFFAKRAASDLWLDNDVQANDIKLGWNLSSPNVGKCLIPAGGGYVGKVDDGRPKWGRWDSLLLAEEDNKLRWVGICDNAVPTPLGLALSFTSLPGWLYHVPYEYAYKVWRTDVFDVVRHLLNTSRGYPNAYTFAQSNNSSAFTVGDINPGPEPDAPVRADGQSMDDYEAMPSYKAWKIAHDFWSEHKDNQYSINWWEAPYIGEEIDNLATETGFDYREEFRWIDKSSRRFEVKMQLSDYFNTRRTDIAFVDGINMAQIAIPKDDESTFANDVIALGAGEGATMLRSKSAIVDGRLYQGQFRPYKSVRDKQRLNRLADADLVRLNNPHPKIDTISAWDTRGNSPIGSLYAGDVVNISSENTTPPYSVWSRVIGIERDPRSALSTIRLEPAQ